MKLITGLVLAVVLVACSSSKPSANSSVPPAAVIKSNAPTAPPASVHPATSSTPGSTPSTGTSQLPHGSPLPTPRAEAPNVPPEPGTYRYRQSGSSKFGTFTVYPDPEGTLTIDRAKSTPDGRSQSQTRRISNNQSTKQTYLFRSDSIELTETVTSAGGQQQKCDPQPPLTVVKLPLKVGTKWTDAATCNGQNITVAGEVLRQERRNVGDASVPTFVVHIVSHFRGQGVSLDDDLTVWLSPAYRLRVHSVDKSTGSYQGVPITENQTEDLESLAPER